MNDNCNPLHAPYYADQAVQLTAEVVENVQLARDTFRVRFACPDLAARITPGQFVMLRLADMQDPLLGRPLAMYDVYRDGSGAAIGIDVVYLVHGKMTSKLASFKPGQRLEAWGPLGNGFPGEQVDHLIMVAGGIGQTPFVALGKEYLGRQAYGNPARQGAAAGKVTMCYGARSVEYLAGVEDFRACGIDVKISTDDGSAGHHGLVTDLLNETLDQSTAGVQIACCGPERMMESVSKIAAERNVPCWVSLETPMACGIGICFTCVAKVRQDDGSWDYKRTCVEGPIFSSEKIEW
ncbi:dihydroorotate dehydrogenase electron transfer subunit [Blastopirellula sp. JC732]|uniref:Dihydroorotate dehydrogenase electron transfer subunit n=1 Tax=Blastopirellula sediminis TaxID=2894196 RepID=A0A9X1MQ95_9BACT|nr:dihydroorotate dehydrogenase electron transfer subunit [Blastopirellula sediminis]MCC9605227.1 dihydroorotate dehydrogenase electron transfer subunit [Blastopirellula sediminis]MCC9631473.1 dihydroorotate dehydrogenase electron transfer subunit [Blastopirellula sediminis]